MPERKTLERARQDKKEGKSSSTQAGEFVREEFHHVQEGKHGARSAKQVVAIGLSKARRAGVKLKPPAKGTVSEETRRKAEREYKKGSNAKQKPASPKRSRAIKEALKKEGRSAGSPKAASRLARATARRRGPAARSAAARKAARTRARQRSR